MFFSLSQEEESAPLLGVTVKCKLNLIAFFQTAVKYLTKCEKLRERRLRQVRPPMMIPNCTRDGDFQLEQCNVYKTKCWCVGMNGKKIPGTKVRNKLPECYLGEFMLLKFVIKSNAHQAFTQSTREYCLAVFVQYKIVGKKHNEIRIMQFHIQQCIM